jgi:hypothetical protein
LPDTLDPLVVTIAVPIKINCNPCDQLHAKPLPWRCWSHTQGVRTESADFLQMAPGAQVWLRGINTTNPRVNVPIPAGAVLNLQAAGIYRVSGSGTLRRVAGGADVSQFTGQIIDLT